MPVERMLKEETPSRVLVARVLAEAGPYFRFYPFSERLPRRYFQPGD